MTILEKLKSAPEKRLPVAMALLGVGLLLVILNVTWKKLGLDPRFGPERSDFARGFVLGVGIAMETAGVVLALMARRWGRKA